VLFDNEFEDTATYVGRTKGIEDTRWPGGQFRGFEIRTGEHECEVAFMYRFEDGRIAERWAVRDDLAMEEQLSGTAA
jgi:predicted ester cyclase